ncbi:hypothetical protein [Gemmata sp.]|uniref:hypothetical protein n=1 Tax=Gemmata sp. TaxID=1914242 RepID=UPI003F6F61E3
MSATRCKAVVLTQLDQLSTLRNSHPIALTDQNRSRAEAQAERERALARALSDLGLTPPEASLFNVIHYGITLPPHHLPERSAGESYRLGGSFTEDACRAALARCIRAGRLQIIDDDALSRIADELREGRFLGPIYGLPPVGGVDFTHAGADLWQRLCARCFRDDRRPPFAFTDVVHERTARYFRTKAAAVEAAEQASAEDEVVSVTGPVPIGPWRAQWWRRFPAGYRVDVVEQRRWQGRASGGKEDCYLDFSARSTDPGRLRDTLDRHNVTLAEWLTLWCMERSWFRDSPASFRRATAESAERLSGVTVSEEQCRDGLDACLRYGWLRRVDQRALDEVRSLLRNDSALLAIPRTAEGRPRVCSYAVNPLRPHRLVPVPMPDARRWGEIDFSPDGATLYRTIMTEWLGTDWEDDLYVSRGYYWEAHYYCTSEDGFEGIVPEHVAKGDVVRDRRVVPIGPWCVYWWERFTAGYRLELELGER